MHETAAERERRLRQLGGGERWHHTSWYWYDMNMPMWDFDETNPCREMDIVISLPQVHRCVLGSNPLVKFTKYKFKF